METLPATPFLSPKRKRDAVEDHTDNRTHFPIRLRTEIPSHPLEDPFAGSYSPRTAVAGQLQGLHIQEEYGTGPISYIPRIKETTSNSNPSSSPETASYTFEIATTGTHTHVTSITTITTPSTPPKTPSTPHLKPVSGKPSRTISPLPSRKISPPRKSPPRSRSPPPPIFFHGSRSPSPSDTIDIQNLGLNGIGYKPTPARVYARAQRRKQQVAEWKAREAKEARQRRIELRGQRETVHKRGLFEPGLFARINAELGMETQPAVRRVRFVEG